MRRELGTVSLIGALLTAAVMAWIAAEASESSSGSWITAPALGLAVVFGAFFLLARVGSTAPNERRSEAAQAMIVSACGAVISLLWALSSIDFTMGRPWRKDRGGRPSRARPRSRADWSAARTACAPDESAAARWLRAALDEHASIAAFSRLSLDLLAHAAPPSLVRWATEAALEEIRHAELCFERASALGGCDVGPSELPTGAATAPSLAVLARESLVDGCIGEGVAAECARRSAELASDPSARAVWTEIARDEARHAELGWAIVEWALERDGEAIRGELRRLMEHLAPPAGGEARIDLEQGWLDAAAERDAWLEVVAGVRARLCLDERSAA